MFYYLFEVAESGTVDFLGRDFVFVRSVVTATENLKRRRKVT